MLSTQTQTSYPYQTTIQRLHSGILLDILRDSRLAWSHKVILTYLCHLPAGTEFTVPQIEKQIPMSHPTVYAAVTRLLSLDLVSRRVVDHDTSITHATVLFSVAPDFRARLINPA